MYAYIKGEQKEWRIRKEDRKDAEGIDAGNGNLWDLYQRCTKGYETKLWADSRENSGYKEGVKQKIIYDYTAGAMAYPDPLNKASRTVVTAEIGKSVSRMRHVIEKPKGSGNYRGLMPIELERLNMFPDNWTEYEGISDSRRGFLMGNALVVGVVERLAGPLAELIRDRSEQ
jgi:site-specific DNA-cytosine methylase